MLEIGNTWVYNYYDINPPTVNVSAQYMTITSDTMVNGDVYSVASFTHEDPCVIHLREDLLREDSGKVYRYSERFDKDLLLYNFNETDQYQIEYIDIWGDDTLHTAICRIDSVGEFVFFDSTVVQAQYTTVIWEQCDFCGTTELPFTVLKNLGSVQYMYPPLGAGLCDVHESVGGLRCFYSDSVFIRNVPHPCDTAYTYVDDPDGTTNIDQDIPVIVYPNPTTGDIRIRADDGIIESVAITSLSGQQLELIIANQEISLVPQEPGIYFLRIHFRNGSVVITPVVKLY